MPSLRLSPLLGSCWKQDHWVASNYSFPLELDWFSKDIFLFLVYENEIQLSLINTGIEFTKDEELIEGINEEMDDENPNGESNI